MHARRSPVKLTMAEFRAMARLNAGEYRHRRESEIDRTDVIARRPSTDCFH